jgi:hypothetical protein
MPETWYVVNSMNGEPTEDVFDNQSDASQAAYYLNADIKDIYEYGLYTIMTEEEWLDGGLGWECV